jgi:hypothetical protein
LQQNIYASKSPQKKISKKEREKSKSQVFVDFFLLRAFTEELENFAKLFFKKNVSSTKIARILKKNCQNFKIAKLKRKYCRPSTTKNLNPLKRH